MANGVTATTPVLTSTAPASIAVVPPSGRALPKKSSAAVGYGLIVLAGMLFEPVTGA